MAKAPVSIQELPTCPFSGKKSFPSKRLPLEFRVVHGGGTWIKPYRCKHCPYWHQAKNG